MPQMDLELNEVTLEVSEEVEEKVLKYRTFRAERFKRVEASALKKLLEKKKAERFPNKKVEVMDWIIRRVKPMKSDPIPQGAFDRDLEMLFEKLYGEKWNGGRQ